MSVGKLAFIASDATEAQDALAAFQSSFPSIPEEEADVIVALGGDGFMLQAMHRFVSSGKAIYGMNRGSVGFLMNEFSDADLEHRLACADLTVVHPLQMQAVDQGGNEHESLAFNEVSLLRQTYQAAKLQIAIDGHTSRRIDL